MPRNKRRHKIGFGYGASANNQQSRPVFSEIKYKLNTASRKSKALDFNSDNLSQAERLEIKNAIRKSNKTKTFKIFIITAISVIVLIIIAMKTIEEILFRN